MQAIYLYILVRSRVQLHCVCGHDVWSKFVSCFCGALLNPGSERNLTTPNILKRTSNPQNLAVTCRNMRVGWKMRSDSKLGRDCHPDWKSQDRVAQAHCMLVSDQSLPHDRYFQQCVPLDILGDSTLHPYFGAILTQR